MAFRVKKGVALKSTVYVDGEKFITREAAEKHAATIRADWHPAVVETDEVVLPITAESVLTTSQKKHFGPKLVKFHGEQANMSVEVRYDDQCGNGHNTFSITADVYAVDRRKYPSDRGYMAGGCLHEDIAKHFPELAKFIKWHLVSSDGPMHYPGNALYFAGDRDHNGCRAGEPCAWDTVVQFGDFPIKWRAGNHHGFMKWLESAQGSDFEVIRIDHEKKAGETFDFGPKYTLGGAPDKWYECPFDTEHEALDFLSAMRLGYKLIKVPTTFSKGKARELDNARSAAVWPEASDAELTAPGLKAELERRLPGLLVEFRAAVEELGFTW